MLVEGTLGARLSRLRGTEQPWWELFRGALDALDHIYQEFMRKSHITSIGSKKTSNKDHFPSE